MPANTLVRDVMTTDVATLTRDQTVPAAADRLAEKGVNGMPVVDAGGKLLGMLRDDDLIASEARVHAPTFINFLGLGVPFPGEMKQLESELKKIAGATVGEVMSTDVPTIGDGATLEDLATLLHESGVSSVPVVDGDNKLVGIVARADVVRFIARTT